MKKLLLGAFVSVPLLASANAFAEVPATEARPQVSGQLQYGAFLGDGDLNPYGLGLNARGGYTLDFDLYLGGSFDFFFGESEDAGIAAANAEVSANAWSLQAEVGYDFGLSREIVLRPKLGLGMTAINAEACVDSIVGGGCTDDSNSEFAFGLGGQFIYVFDTLYFTGEMRFNLVDDANALIFGAGLGAAF